MWIDYGRRVTETVEELARQERALRGHPGGDRIRLLRLLKSGEERSLARAATTLGYCERQVQRWWQRYTTGGVAGLLEIGRPGGRRERITAAAWEGLCEQMRAGQIGRLQDAQSYLKEQWDLHYCLDAVSKLFRRRQTKLKTGRPRHRRTDAAAQAAFKKGARGDAGSPPGAPGVRSG